MNPVPHQFDLLLKTKVRKTLDTTQDLTIYFRFIIADLINYLSAAGRLQVE